MNSERDAEFLVRWNSGQTLEEIGSAYGVTRERVRQILKRLKGKGFEVIDRRERSIRGKRSSIEDVMAKAAVDIIREVEAGVSQTKIAEKFGLSTTNVKEVVRRLRASGELIGPLYEPTDNSKAVWRIIKEGRLRGERIRDLVDKLGISKTAVARHMRLMRENGVLPPSVMGPKVDALLAARREKVIREMMKAGAKRQEIANELGISVHVLARQISFMRSKKSDS